MKSLIPLLILLLDAEYQEVQGKKDFDNDYDYNCGFQDGLMTAINVINKYNQA